MGAIETNGKRVWKARLLARGPREWARVVGQVQPPELRAEVAAIVWWDFFSARCSHGLGFDARFVGARQMQPLMEGWTPAGCTDTGLIADGLRAVGYGADAARTRARMPKLSNAAKEDVTCPDVECP
ncbi:MAG: hypothetical protein KJ579_07330 [Verrucomicrobia bacterium]|nr:hypothetical protein [Verrucomicrobiota bacterium]